jgi:hypothetical protein
MSASLSESAIVKALAGQSARHLTRKVILRLERMKVTLSGDDSELKTTWDEICAQIQSEESFAWDAYNETVKTLVESYVAELPTHEKEALWLRTDEGIDWDCEEPQDREAYPVFEEDVVRYLMSDFVYVEAGRWSNRRIRAFMDRSSRRD